MLSVVSNVTTLASVATLARTDDAAMNSLRRLSSGYRVTTAADDASGLGISEALRAQVGGMTQAVRNTQDGVSVLQVADGALGESSAILMRMRDLAVQAANTGALDARAVTGIQDEMDQLKGQLDAIAEGTEFAGTKLLDGSYAKLFQVGADVGQTIGVVIGGPGHGAGSTDLGLDGVDVTGQVSLASTTASAVSAAQGTPAAGVLTLAGDYVTPGSYPSAFAALGGTVSYGGKSFDLGSVDYTGAVTATDYVTALNTAAVAALGTSFTPFVGTATGLVFTGATPGAGTTATDAAALTPTYTGKSGAGDAITLIDRALDRMASLRADLGATTDRFEHTIDRLNSSITNTSASESRIRDTDMATEMTSFSRTQILQQAGSAMLSHVAQSSQLVLKLLG
jgi:flagellin